MSSGIKATTLNNILITLIILFSCIASFDDGITANWCSILPILLPFILGLMGAIYLGKKDQINSEIRSRELQDGNKSPTNRGK